MLHFFWSLFNMYRSSGSTLIPIPTTLKFQLNQKRKNAETINFVQLFINFNYNLTELNGILNDYSSRVAFFREKFIFSFFIIPNEWVIPNDMHFNLFLRFLYCIDMLGDILLSIWTHPPSNFLARSILSNVLIIHNFYCLMQYASLFSNCFWSAVWGFFSVARFNCTDTFQTMDGLSNFPPKIEGFPYWNWHFLLSVWFEFDQVKKKWNII